MKALVTHTLWLFALTLFICACNKPMGDGSDPKGDPDK